MVSPEATITDPIVAVERGSVVNALSLTGNVARDEIFAVRSEIDGTVTAVHVSEGAAVSAGQKLFTIRQEDPRKDIDVLAPEAGDVSEIALVKGQPTSVGTEIFSLTPRALPPPRDRRPCAAVPPRQRADRGHGHHHGWSGTVRAAPASVCR